MDVQEIAEEDIVARQAGVAAGSPLYDALLGRADIMAMTQKAHDASLLPEDPGGLSHAERAALAARVARLNGDTSLAAHYTALMNAAGADPAVAALADPAGKDHADNRLTALAAYTDLTALSPKDATAGDIDALKTAGIGDADIVRLAELTAFLAYQIRVIAGLKLMQAAP